jgi:acyl-CoA dehydrogenase
MDDWPEIRSSIARLCAGFPGSYWQEQDAQRAYPTAFVEALARDGWLAALIPEDHGGAGLPLSAACAILEEIHASGGNGAAAHAQMYVMGTLLRHGSAAQKAAWLPAIARGELRLQAFGVTEPDAGSDTLSISTTAVRDGDDYVISGRKIWTSRAQHSDLMLLLARTTPKDQVARRTDGLSVFVLDMRDCPGLSIQPIATMMNHGTTSVFFDDVRVPAANRIGEEGQGFRYILSGMNAERILIAAECLGDARFFLDRACDHARTRQVFGRPIGQNQGIQFPLAMAHARAAAARLMVADACRRQEAGEVAGAEANMAKLLAAEASWQAGEAALQTLGGMGFAAEYDVERKFRETRLYQVAPVSTNLILAHLAEHVLGLPRSY